MSSSSASIESLLATKEILVFCGSGGVGKTSVAASAGLAAATHMDGKVLVVTVDPAKRLADALGIEGIGNIERRVPPEAFAAALTDQQPSGYLKRLKPDVDGILLVVAPTVRLPRSGSSCCGRFPTWLKSLTTLFTRVQLANVSSREGAHAGRDAVAWHHQVSS